MTARRALAVALLACAACRPNVAPGRRAAPSTPSPSPPTAATSAPAERARLVLQTQPGAVVVGLTFSADGARLASSAADGSVRVHDTRTWRTTQLLAGLGHTPVVALDGTTIIAGTGGYGRFAMGSGAPVRLFAARSTMPSGLLDLGDGHAFRWALLEASSIELLDAAESTVRTLPLPAYPQHAALAPDRQSFVVHAGRDFAHWSAEQPSHVATWKASEPPNACTLLSGTQAALARRDALTIHDAATGRLLQTLSVPRDVASIRLLAADAKGHLVAAAGRHLIGWKPHVSSSPVWSSEAPLEGVFEFVSSLAFGPDGKTLAIGTSNGRLLTYDVRESGLSAGRDLGGRVQRPREVVFDGETLAVLAGNGLSTWSLATGERTSRRVEPYAIGLGPGDAGGVVVAQGALLEQVGSDLPSALTWEASRTPFAAGTRPPRFDPHEKNRLAVRDELAPDEPLPRLGSPHPWLRVPRASIQLLEPRTSARGWVAIDGNSNTTTRLSHPARGRSFEIPRVFLPVHIAPNDEVVLVRSPDDSRAIRLRDGALLGSLPGAWLGALNADGSQMAGAAGNRVATLDLPSGSAKPRFSETPGYVSALVYEPSRALLVGTVAGSLLRVRVGERVEVLGSADGGAIEQLWPSPDGRRAAAQMTDGGLVVWDLAERKPVVKLIELDDDTALALTPDGWAAGSIEGLDHAALAFAGGASTSLAELPERFDPSQIACRLSSTRCADAPKAFPPPTLELEGIAKDGGSRMRVSVVGSPGATVRVFRNGVPAEEEARIPSPGRAALDVDLRGANTLHLVAFDGRGRASAPLSIAGDAGTSSDTERPELHVLAIGIGHYPSLPSSRQLRVADDDAFAIARLFERFGGAGAGRAYGAVHVTKLINGDATVASIDAALAKLATMKARDVAVILFAGHGIRLRSGESALVTGAWDGKTLDPGQPSLLTWASFAKRIAAMKGRTLVLLDACHSGAFQPELLAPNATLATELSKASRAGTVLFAASRGTQESREAEWNGLFTGTVMDVLTDPRSDLDADGWIDDRELAVRVGELVDRSSQGWQMPWLARREVFGSFRLVPVTQ